MSDPEGPIADRWRLVLPVSSAMFLAAISNSMGITVMPSVARSLGGVELYPWVLTVGNALVTSGILAFGRLSDVFGRRAVVLGASLTFTLASILSVLCRSFEQMILAYGLQAIGAAGIFSVAQAIFADIFRPEERAMAEGYLSSTWTVASLAGPVLGGALVQHLGWRAVFLAEVPVGVLTTFLVVKSPNRNLHTGSRGRVDVLGMVGLVAAILLLQLGCHHLGQGGSPTSPAVAATFGAAVMVAGLLALHESRNAHAMLPPSLFASRGLVPGCAVACFTGMAVFANTTFLSLFAQWRFQSSPTAAGLMYAPFVIAITIGSSIIGRLVVRAGLRSTTMAGLALVVAALVWLMWAMGGSVVKVALGLVPLGLGFGMVSISTIVAAQISAPPDQQGMASASPIFFRSLGGTIGPAIVGAFLYGALRHHGASAAPLAAGASFASPPIVKRALTEGAIRGLWFGIGCALVAFIVSRWLPRSTLGLGRKQTREGAREPNVAVRE